MNRPPWRCTVRVLGALIGVLAVHTMPAQAPPVARHGTDRGWSLSPASAPPVTVADLIGMTTIDSRVQGYGDEDYDVVSPDGAHLAVVVKRGNLARNTVDFALLVFTTADLLRAPRPDTVATFASSSNRPGIAHVRWLSDNLTLAFLGERPGELPQLYTLDTHTRTLTQRTHATTVITAFDIAGAGDPVVVYAAESPRDTSKYPAMRAHGFVVPPRALVSDVIAGDWGSRPSWEAKVPRTLHVMRAGRETTVPVPDSAAGYRGCQLGDFPTLSIATTGDVALMQCTPLRAPAEWSGYQQEQYRQFADLGRVYAEYMIVDLTTGRAHLLMNAPADFGTTIAWAPDGRSVVLANAMLPLDVADPTERRARATHEMLAEVDVHTGAVTVIAHRDSLSVLAWDPRDATVELVPGAYMTPTETRRVFYRKTAKGWVEVPATTSAGTSASKTTAAPAVVIDQGLNTPARLVAVNPRTKARRVIYDPNPGLLTMYRFGREDVIHWKTKAGADWVGGLYWPPDYVPGKRYPLVIQRHGFDSTAFWPYGVYSTGEAAQPLANVGVMVLQMPDDPPREPRVTPREGPLSMEGAEGAIDYLDSLGLIDRAKVGMQGFSRTCFYTLYFLTHSRYPLAAATLTDGVDKSYLQHLIFEPTRIGSGDMAEDRAMNGGEPFGPSLKTWMERAPGFNLDHVTAPLLLTALTALSLLGEWEPYAGLLLQGKPAELVYIPDGEHILTKSRERLTSQQGAVDWYRFWLKGEEDPDPAKAAQYLRWHALRAMRDTNATPAAAARAKEEGG